MKLDVRDRLVLLQVLPQVGNFVTLKVVRELQNVLALSEEEIKEFNVVHKDDHVEWNEKGTTLKEIEIGDKAKEIIVDALKKKDEEKAIDGVLYNLCVRFEVFEQ